MEIFTSPRHRCWRMVFAWNYIPSLNSQSCHLNPNCWRKYHYYGSKFPKNSNSFVDTDRKTDIRRSSVLRYQLWKDENYVNISMDHSSEYIFRLWNIRCIEKTRYKFFHFFFWYDLFFFRVQKFEIRFIDFVKKNFSLEDDIFDGLNFCMYTK